MISLHLTGNKVATTRLQAVQRAATQWKQVEGRLLHAICGQYAAQAGSIPYDSGDTHDAATIPGNENQRFEASKLKATFEITLDYTSFIEDLMPPISVDPLGQAIARHVQHVWSR